MYYVHITQKFHKMENRNKRTIRCFKKWDVQERMSLLETMLLLLLSTPGSSDSGPSPRYPRSRPHPSWSDQRPQPSRPPPHPGSSHSSSGPRSVANLGQLNKCLVLCGCVWHRGQFGVGCVSGVIL